MRLDIYLVESGLVESRNKASRLICESKVAVDGKIVSKPSENIDGAEHKIEIIENEKYVSRGGLKLEAALDYFRIDVKDKRCIDIGASTGGFSDCLLQRGAKSICAVDSGRGQLHSKILSDIRVSSIEGYNARNMSADEFGFFDIAVMDVSFISQTLIHQAVSDILHDGAIFISLIKPQFEAGKSALGKNGIVKNALDREMAINKVLESSCLFNMIPRGIINSPITGGDGNREYLALFEKSDNSDINVPDEIKALIKKLCRG